MQPRNILFLHNPRRAPFSYGGIERVTLMLAEWFSRRGIGVYVIANAVDMEAIPEHQRSAAVWLPTPQRKMSYSDYCRYAGECCRKWDIDVVICQGGYLRRMEILRRMTDAPIVYCNHSQPFWEIVRSLAGYDRTHRHLTPLYLLSRAYKQWKTRRRVMRRYRSMYRSVDSYVLLCEGYVREFYDAMGAAAEAEGKAVAIYNPAAVPDALPDLSRKQRRLLFVGRLSYSDKRVDRLLQVWSRLQDEFADWSLDIVGDGEERGELERMAAELGLRRVTFCGATSDPSPWYDRASILCQTSSYEGWGMVLIEAQQHGAIPVAFDCSAGVREIVGRCGGVLVDSFDLDAYADALRRLMSSDEERARIVEVITRNRARYGIERSGESWMRLFATLDRHS